MSSFLSIKLENHWNGMLTQLNPKTVTWFCILALSEFIFKDGSYQ